MSRKRNQNRSKLEREQHKAAVKIRKMTDEQLCDFIEEISHSQNESKTVSEFLDELEQLNYFSSGISRRTIGKLRKIAAVNGYIKEVET